MAYFTLGRFVIAFAKSIPAHLANNKKGVKIHDDCDTVKYAIIAVIIVKHEGLSLIQHPQGQSVRIALHCAGTY